VGHQTQKAFPPRAGRDPSGRTAARGASYPHHVAIGAAVTLTDAFAALVADRPQLATSAAALPAFRCATRARWAATLPMARPSGTPCPLLIALGASVVLMAWRGKGDKAKAVHRELRLEDLYTGYRQNVMAPDEVLAWIKVPKTVPYERSRVYKISQTL